MVISIFASSDSEDTAPATTQPAVDLRHDTPRRPPPLPEPPPIDDDDTIAINNIQDDDDTIATMQLILNQGIFDIDNDNDTTALNEDDLISSTITVRHPLSSTVPSLVPRYSTTTIDGEWVLLFRSAYRVNVLLLLFQLMYRVDRMYRVGTILPSIVILRQSGSVCGNINIDDDNDNDTSKDNNGDDDEDWYDNNIIIILHEMIFYRWMYRVGAGKIVSPTVLLLLSDDRYSYSTTTIDGELILLFRLAYRVDRMYHAIAVMQLVVLYQAKYKMIRHGDHDTIAIVQLVAHYQDVNDDDDDDTTTIMHLVVLYQDKYHTIAVVSSLDRNREYYYLYNHNNVRPHDPKDSTRKNGETKVVDDVPTDSTYDRSNIGTVSVTRSTTYFNIIYTNYNNIRCNDGDYHNNTMMTNGERTTSVQVGNFNDDKAKSRVKYRSQSKYKDGCSMKLTPTTEYTIASTTTIKAYTNRNDTTAITDPITITRLVLIHEDDDYTIATTQLVVLYC